LLSAMPTFGPPNAQSNARIRLTGDPPSGVAPPSGCVFHPRCPRKLGAVCEEHDPPFTDAGEGHRIRCHIPVHDLRALQRETQSA